MGKREFIFGQDLLDFCKKNQIDTVFGMNTLTEDVIVLKDFFFLIKGEKISKKFNNYRIRILKEAIEKFYGIKIYSNEFKQLIKDLALKNNFTPSIEEIITLPKWDGKKRVETVFIDYLGAKDNKYTREVTILFFRALFNTIIPKESSSIYKWKFLPIIVNNSKFCCCYDDSDFLNSLFDDIKNIYWGRSDIKDIVKKSMLSEKTIQKGLGISLCYLPAYLEMFSTGIVKYHDKLKYLVEHSQKTLYIGFLYSSLSQHQKALLVAKSNWRYLPIYCNYGEDYNKFKIDMKILSLNKEQILAEALFLYKEADNTYRFSNEIWNKKLEVNRKYDEIRYKLINKHKSYNYWDNKEIIRQTKKIQTDLF